jgi:hypothetical protein
MQVCHVLFVSKVLHLFTTVSVPLNVKDCRNINELMDWCQPTPRNFPEG